MGEYNVISEGGSLGTVVKGGKRMGMMENDWSLWEGSSHLGRCVCVEIDSSSGVIAV